MIQTNSFIKELEQAIKKLLPNVVIDKNNVMGSTVLDGRGKPIVRIDSKAKPTALWVAVDDTSGTVKVILKTIANNKESNLPGHGQKLFAAVADVIMRNQKSNRDASFEIVVDHDVSSGFWKHMETKYPTIPFTYVNND